MLIKETTEQECRDVLVKATIARLGCALDNQPYVVPLAMAYEADYIYFFSTAGKKIEWMRANPKVCVQVDSLSGQSDWISVIANGEYQELDEPRYSDERNHARKLLERRHNWWLNALAERRTQSRDQDILPIFFRVKISSLTGLRGLTEGE
ncbi:MAG TPA: pyridoxamine 5'-phosphate oxidase family protein [Candidatus Sulfotelmatobacter sp.]|nr:pyridoxamine 5'-phosphate oxidase family protein [Candidatus Sulfotelmatobacter sp.]